MIVLAWLQCLVNVILETQRMVCWRMSWYSIVLFQSFKQIYKLNDLFSLLILDGEILNFPPTHIVTFHHPYTFTCIIYNSGCILTQTNSVAGRNSVSNIYLNSSEWLCHSLLIDVVTSCENMLCHFLSETSLFYNFKSFCCMQEVIKELVGGDWFVKCSIIYMLIYTVVK